MMMLQAAGVITELRCVEEFYENSFLYVLHDVAVYSFTQLTVNICNIQILMVMLTNIMCNKNSCSYLPVKIKGIMSGYQVSVSQLIIVITHEQ